MRGWRPLATAVVAVGCCALSPGSASAAFPGSDGPIVFQSTLPGVSPCNPYTSSELFSVAGEVGPVTQVDCNGHTDQHVFVSPDGSDVVFASNRAGGSGAFQLYTESLTSPGTAVDVSYPANAGIDDYPSWAPATPGNQGSIIFQRTLPGASPQLYREDVNTPSVPAAPVFPSATGFSDTEPVFDPSNANEIAFVRQAAGGPQQIFTYDLANPATPPVNLSAADGDGSSNDSKPDFAPSLTGTPATQEIVLQSDRPTAAAEGGPCVGTQLYTVTDQTGAPVTPVFEVMAGSPPAPTGQQACPKMNGSEVATENPVFSPQGDAIAYDEPGPNSQNVFTFTLDFSDGSGDTNTVSNVSPNFATDEAPSWGPVLPGASTPEVPQSVLLPVAGTSMFAAAGVLSLRRRRRRDAAVHGGTSVS
jgi:Tol biopolymer transport system component